VQEVKEKKRSECLLKGERRQRRREVVMEAIKKRSSNVGEKESFIDIRTQ
jgi:hypothetical protein